MPKLKDTERQPRIYDDDSLRRWLEALASDRQRAAGAAIVVRAVLRGLPMIERAAVESNAELLGRLAQAAFWAAASTWVAAKYLTRDKDLRTAEAASAAHAFATAARADSTRAGAPTIARAATAADAIGRAALAATPATAARAVATAALAATPARATTAARAATAIWRATSADVAALEAGRPPSDLAGDPLWPQGAPKWANERWAILRDLLSDEHWRPWLDWYQRRLDGTELSEEIELLLATLPVDPREKDPAEQNALLAREIARLTGQVPRLDRLEIPQAKPAAIEPIAADGRIRLRDGLASAELDARALNAALRALKQQFADLVANLDAESNIDKRATASLRRLADLIPTKRPTQAQLFRLAHEQEKLEAYAASVVAEWPSTLAADYLAAARAFDRTVRQFPKWRAFKANAEKDRLTVEQREAAPRIADDLAYALREDEAAEFVEQEIASIVSSMASRLAAQRDAEAARFDPIAAGADLLAEDLVTSMENVVKAIAEAAISPVVGVAGTAKRAGKKFARQADKSIVKEAGRLGDDFGPALTKWAKRALIGAPVAGAGYGVVKTGLLAYDIQKLMQAYPHIAEWLKPILDYLS